MFFFQLGLLILSIHLINAIIFRPGVAFQFSHVNITVTDYAMAIFSLKENIRYLFLFLRLEFVLISLSSVSRKHG